MSDSKLQAPSSKLPVPTAEQKIDAAIQRASTSSVVIDLAAASITPADITPDLLGLYHTAGWRTAELKDGTLTLSS